MGWVEEKEKEDMFNKHCKKVALIMALSMMTSVTAFAAKKEFNFNVVVERISKYSAENPKSDNEGYAYVIVLLSMLFQILIEQQMFQQFMNLMVKSNHIRTG